MTKRLFKFLISFLLIFVLIGKVEAALVCGEDTYPVTIVEEKIDDAGFDVKAPVCYIDYSKGPDHYTGIGSFSTRDEAYDSGLLTELT